MRKLTIVLLFMALAQMGFAQYFTLTPKGFLTKDQEDYIVLDYPDIKQAELYMRVQQALVSMYKNPNKVLSLIEAESITINAYETDAITNKRWAPLAIGKATFKYDLSYSLSILFKDGKIRFNRPTFDCKRWYEVNMASGWEYLHLVKVKNRSAGIFNNKGEVIAQDALDELNSYMNSLIKEIVDKLQNAKNDW